jgi:hypothetical protein
MPRVFICYRTSETESFAARLSAKLEVRFGSGNIFRDTDKLKAGEDWLARLRKELNRSHTLLVIIGPKWLDELREREQRSARDYVKFEVETALRRKIRIIPVLVNDVQMPDQSDLPKEMGDLAFRQFVRIRDSGSEFEQGFQELLKRLPNPVYEKLIKVVIGVVLLVALLLLVDQSVNRPRPQPSREVDTALSFLLDSSTNMATELYGGLSRYNVALSAIQRIINTPGIITPTTWLSAQTAGGGEGRNCRQTQQLPSLQYSAITPDQYLQPLWDIEAKGNTAYQAGFTQLWEDQSLAIPLSSRTRVAFVFLGSTVPSPDCMQTDDLDLGLMLDRFRQANVSMAICAFTFFDEQDAADALQQSLAEVGVDCMMNVTEAGDIEPLVDTALRKIRQVRDDTWPTPTLTPSQTPSPTLTPPPSLSPSPAPATVTPMPTTAPTTEVVPAPTVGRTLTTVPVFALPSATVEAAPPFASVGNDEIIPTLKTIVPGERETGPDFLVMPGPRATVLPLCLVSSSSRSVRVRVGPSHNRNALANLEPDQRYRVLGYNDDAGEKWYLIDFPNTLPLEATRRWIEASMIEETGDCSGLPEAPSPSLILWPTFTPSPLVNNSSAPDSPFAPGPEPGNSNGGNQPSVTQVAPTAVGVTPVVPTAVPTECQSPVDFSESGC